MLAMEFMVTIEMPMSPGPGQYNMASTQSMDFGKMAAEMKECPVYGDIVCNNANVNSLSAGSAIAGVIVFCFALTFNYRISL